MRCAALIAILAPLTLLFGAEQPNTANPTYEHPLIKHHGGIVPVPDAAQPPQAGAKVVFDIISDNGANKVTKGLDRVALFLNLYSDFDVKPAEVDAAIILHGDATKAALRNQAYARRTGSKTNPNLEVIRALKRHGVEVYVCAQALAHHNFGMDEVADAVDVAASAATVNVNLQMDGYARIPF